METFMTESLTKRKRGYLRNGTVKVLPVKRSSDWLQENSDSAFMNSGAKIEYVVPRHQRTGQLIDPLSDLTDTEKDTVARQLGFKDGQSLNINIIPEKNNFWINKPVNIDRNGKFLDLSNVGDFILYKILEVNLEAIAPSWEERFDKGTYKFAFVFEAEEAKLKNVKIDTKKEAYMQFGRIDGSVKKLSNFMWIYYLTNKEGKRLPNNPDLDFLRGEVGRIIEEKPGEFLAIITDPDFETKALIQKAINHGLIQREGMMFKVFGEDIKNTLEGLINYLKDERNNNVRISLIGKIENNERGVSVVIPVQEKKEIPTSVELTDRFDKLEQLSKDAMETNVELKETNLSLANENAELLRKLEELSSSDDVLNDEEIERVVRKRPNLRGPKKS